LIHESAPWKDRLLSDADTIERWAAKRSISLRRSTLLEQKIFISAFSIRKLLEGKKLSSKFEDMVIRCEGFAAKTKRITRCDHHRVDENYDFEKPISRNVGVRDLLDLLIHSFTFGEAIDDEGRVDGFFVTSDKNDTSFG
jgi:hypothetical protein